MGLIARVANKVDTWHWRVRYWFMDTETGQQTHVMLFCVSVLVLIMQLIKISIAALQPPPPGEPVKAVYWWVVQLIIAIISAILSYMLRPKAPKTPDPKHEGPRVEDGITFDNFYGTHWHEDEGMPAWKVVGKKKIKQKGGKK